MDELTFLPYVCPECQIIVMGFETIDGVDVCGMCETKLIEYKAIPVTDYAALRERAEKAEAELAKMLLADFADVYSEKKLKADKIAEKFWDTWEDVEKAALKGDA